MMLLGAIVLVIGFLILSSLVARVSQIPAETARESGDILEEAAVVEAGVSGHVVGLPSEAALDASMSHLARIESNRGYMLTWRCGILDGAPADSLELTLAGLDGRVVLTLAAPSPC